MTAAPAPDEGALPTRLQIYLPFDATTGADPRLAERVVAALRAHPAARDALAAPAAGGPPYVSLAELGGMPPPEDAVFYNEAIGTLSVPMRGGQGMEAVREALREVAPAARVEPEATYRTQ